MKKTYIIPLTEIEEVSMVTLQTASGVKGMMNGTLEIGFGGVDENGELEPAANGFGNWDDDSWDKL